MNYTNFQIGDVVRKRGGKKPWEITNIRNYGQKIGPHTKIEGRYVDSNTIVHAYIDRIVMYNDTEETTTMTKAKLYQTKDKEPRYGTLLAINSQGLLVLEMKDNPTVPEVFKKSDVDVVTPFTFEVQHLGRNNVQTFVGTDNIKVDDILLSMDTSTLMRVTKVNTKSEKAVKEFKGRRLVTEEV